MAVRLPAFRQVGETRIMPDDVLDLRYAEIGGCADTAFRKCIEADHSKTIWLQVREFVGDDPCRLPGSQHAGSIDADLRLPAVPGAHLAEQCRRFACLLFSIGIQGEGLVGTGSLRQLCIVTVPNQDGDAR